MVDFHGYGASPLEVSVYFPALERDKFITVHYYNITTIVLAMSLCYITFISKSTRGCIDKIDNQSMQQKSCKIILM